MKTSLWFTKKLLFGAGSPIAGLGTYERYAPRMVAREDFLVHKIIDQVSMDSHKILNTSPTAGMISTFSVGFGNKDMGIAVNLAFCFLDASTPLNFKVNSQRTFSKEVIWNTNLGAK